MASQDTPDTTTDALAGAAGSTEAVPADAADRPARRRATKRAAAPARSGDEVADAAQAGAEQPAPEEGLATPAAKKAVRKTAKKAVKRTAKKAVPDAAASAPDAGPSSGSASPAPDPSDASSGASSAGPDRHEVPRGSAGRDPQVPAPTFGLVFQAPDVTAAPRSRRASAPAQTPAQAPTAPPEHGAVDEATDRGGDVTGEEQPPARGRARRSRGRGATTAGPDERAGDREEPETPEGSRSVEGSDRTEHTDGSGPDDDEQGGDTSTRRRRRGGRGRRGRGGAGEELDDSAAGEDAEGPGEAAGGPRTEPGSDDDAETGSSRRRRRRRRSGGGDDGDTAPGTVTKVRAPRREREEPTAVKGSTRLEAKKQRRREGREAGRRRTIITEAEFLARRESVERVMVVRGIGDRTQIGVLEDGVLVEHYVSRETTASMAGNVYLGRVQNVLPSMEAAFVDIGKGRNAVLYAGEVNWDAAGMESNTPKRIENALSSGDTVLVQVTKDPIGHKGARLTSQISLPGRYLVYVPEGSMTGISRKLPDTERARLKAILKEVVPDTAGVIVRTAAEGASEEELRADVERLTKIWDVITKKAQQAGSKKAAGGGAPTLLHGEPDLTIRVIRDVFTEDFTSLVVAGDTAWSQVNEYVDDVAPDLASRVTRWTSEEDVFHHHRIDEQLAKALDRKVWLPSGGSLVIDRTEAMTVIDVNTGKFVGSGGNLEETVTKNNIEAAEEIVRQLRVRDVGGIIVIDFIDMVLESNRDLVVRRLLECLGRDRTKHQVAEVTSLGLVQMTRKRVGSGLLEVFSEPCEHCNGRGLLVHTEPVVKGSGGGSDSGGGSNGSGEGSRSRPRRPRADSPAGSSVAPEGRTTASTGPTPAQIAAAAHAAAIKGMSGEAGEDDVADLGSVTSVIGAGAEVRREDAAAGGPRDERAPGDDGTTSPGDGAATSPGDGAATSPGDGAATSPGDGAATWPGDGAATSPSDALRQVSWEAPAPVARTRRRRGRVVAPAGPPRGVADEAPGPAPVSGSHAGHDSADEASHAADDGNGSPTPASGGTAN